MRRKYFAKKAAAFLVYFLAGLLVAYEAWPGILSPPVLTADYLTFVGGLFVLVVLLVFLAILTWNERLACIDAGRLTWPFPYKDRSGVRTRYVPLEEISEVRRTAESSSRHGADLVLRDGTQLFLPEKVFGEDGPAILDRLAQYVNRGMGGDHGGTAP